MRRRDAHGLAGATRAQHHVAQRLQHACRDLEDGRLVLDQEDRLLTSRARPLALRHPIGLDRPDVPRQVKLEGGALARLARDDDEAIVLNDGTVDRGQTEAGSPCLPPWS